MKAEDFVSKDFGNLASALGGVARSLKDNKVLLLGLVVAQEQSGSIGDISSNSGNSSNSDFVLRGLFNLFLDLNIFISGSGVLV